jgi:hypothetical protein
VSVCEYAVPAAPSGSGEAVEIVRLGGEMVKINAPDVFPVGFATVTLAVPRAAISLAGIEAVSREALTNAVVRLEPFHFTVAPERKPDPLTVRVNPDPPALAELGLILVSAGAGSGSGSSGSGSAMVNVNPFVAVVGVDWLSRTRTVKDELPGADGVPLRMPVEPASANPAGSDPVVTDQV